MSDEIEQETGPWWVCDTTIYEGGLVGATKCPFHKAFNPFQVVRKSSYDYLTAELAKRDERIAELEDRISVPKKHLETMVTVNEAKYLLAEKRIQQLEEALKKTTSCLPYWDYSDEYLLGIIKQHKGNAVGTIAEAQLSARQALGEK